MQILKPLAALSIGALLSVTLAAPAQAQTFGPTPFLIADVDPVDVAVHNPGRSAVLGSKILFAAGPNGEPTEPWISDGTPRGTKMLKDLNPGNEGSFPNNFVAFKGKVYFAATDPSAGTEVWCTDGTTAGTRRVTDVNPGNVQNAMDEFTVAGGRLYFTTRTADLGRELWSTDGTAGNTHVVLDIQTGTGDSFPGDLTPFDGGLAFSARDANGDHRPWFTSGTAASTRLLDGGSGGLALGAHEIVALGSTLLFRATSAAGKELWRSTSAALSASLVKDISPGAASSDPTGLVSRGDTVFFRARTPEDGIELWSTDGTRGGTQQVRDIREGPEYSQPDDLIVAGDAVYFRADDGVHGKELWVTHGRSSSTRLVKDINPGPTSSEPFSMRPVANTLTFSAVDPVLGRLMWTTDGTPAGTSLAGDLAIAANNSFAQVGATVVFDAFQGGRHQVWGFTTRGSSTRAYPRSSYSRKDGSKKRIRITVKVSAPGTTPGGTVVLRWGSRTIGSANLSRGTATVRITTKLGKGSHTVKAYYLGSTQAQVSTSKTFNVKVR